MNGRGDLLLAFAFAVAAHGGVALLGLQGFGGGGAGDDGTDRMSISAAPPELAALVRAWDEPPESSGVDEIRSPEIAADAVPEMRGEAAVSRPPKPSAPAHRPVGSPPTVVLPSGTTAFTAPASDNRPLVTEAAEARVSSIAPSALFRPDRGAPLDPVTNPPAADFAPTTSVVPVGRPDRTTSPAVARRVASGAGGSVLSGEETSRALQKPDRRDKQAATLAWAAEIQRRIARHHVYPRGSRDEGRVRVAMIVLPTGTLSRVSVERSSGSRSLDRAAIEAVRRAAPFPPAPDGLNEASYSVGQWITFERR